MEFGGWLVNLLTFKTSTCVRVMSFEPCLSLAPDFGNSCGAQETQRIVWL